MAPKIDKVMLLRVVLFLAAILNQGLIALGHSPLPIDEVYIETLVSWLWLVVTGLWAMWKDNPFTKKARINKAKQK